MQIILLPGMDGTGRLFGPLIKKLEGQFPARVISYPGDIHQSYEELTDVVVQQLPEKDDFILLAESFSGPIGYSIASDPPENLKAVIFLATFLTPPNRYMRVISSLPLGILFKLPIPTFLIKSFLLGKAVDDKVIKLFRQSLNLVKSNVLASRVKQMSRLKGGDRSIEMPCAYVSAGNDNLVSKYHIVKFRRIAPRLEVIEIEGPHFIAQARPNECAEVIRKYASI